MKRDQILSQLRCTWHNLPTLQWTVLLVLMGIAPVSSLVAAVAGNEEWDGLLLNFGTEMAAAVVTHILLQMLVGTRARKADLIAQMGSDVRDVVIAAAEELRRRGCLTDGSL